MLASCTNDAPEIIIPKSIPELLLGTWIKSESIDLYTTIYSRTDSLIVNEYGFIFNSEDFFLERRPVGPCGTPPYLYDDFQGTWVAQDSTLQVTTGYWGGVLERTWKVVSIDENNLTILIE